MRTTAAPPEAAPADDLDDRWWYPARWYLLVAAVLFVVAWLSATNLSNDPDTLRLHTEHFDDVLGHWLRFDSGWYLSIAEHGYDAVQVQAFEQGEQSAVAFFPAYPYVVEGGGWLIGDRALASLLVTFLSGLAVAVLFWHWCSARGRLDGAARRAALFALLLYPFGWFLYSSAYADAFLVMAALTAFLLLEADRPVLAGLAGAVATAARPTGVAVLLGLVAVTLERRGAVRRDGGGDGRRRRWRLDLRRLRPGDLGVGLAALGLLGFMLFLWRRVDDPVAFMTVQEAWGHPTGWELLFKFEWFRLLFGDVPLTWRFGLVAHAAVTLLFLGAVPFVVRRFGWGYGAYSAVAVLVPFVGTSTFMGVGRYMLAAFPVFALSGEVLADRRALRVVVLVGSALALVGLSSYFARGYYLS